MGNFYSDTIQKDARFNSVQRIAGLNLLEPVTRQQVEKILADAKAQRLKLIVYETYRSQARQEQLFQQGAMELKEVGVHHYGLACDIAKFVINEPSWKGSFGFLNDLARQNGLIWGGDWDQPEPFHGFKDADHVQRCSLMRQDALFRLEWYPDETYNPYHD